MTKKYQLQKQVKKEIDKICPSKKDNWEHNISRCKLNAKMLQESGRKKNEK